MNISSSSSTLASASPSRKRSLSTSTGSEANNLDGQPVAKHLKVEVTRDTDYYFDDGSCVFLVEDTLFNVCHNRLLRLMFVCIGQAESFRFIGVG